MFDYYISQLENWAETTIPKIVNQENFLLIVGSFFALGFFYILVQKQYDTYNSTLYVINYYYPYGYLLCILVRLANLH